MRVKNDHPNTNDNPQKVEMSPVPHVSKELESRFDNALKPKKAEKERESEASRLFATVLNADKLDHSNHKDQLNRTSSKLKKELLENEKDPAALILDSKIASPHDPKTLSANLPNILKDQTQPIQPEHTQPSTVQSVIQGQQHKLDKATQKIDPTTKDAAAFVDSKAVLSTLEEKIKPLKHVELSHRSESEAKLPPTINPGQSPTQGDSILRNIETQAPSSRTQDVTELINKLVKEIHVSLPSVNAKEVRLLINEGQLKGGEISIKQDNFGYSVVIRQEHALSLISQTAKQDLTNRLNSLGIEQPIRVTVSEQMNHQQNQQDQQDQQRSRQQRSIYDEWQPEDEI
ncbi:type III secretion system needle length determinant [Vibrio sp. AND4]|uniref:type III secretion system needle length determinant n=1 Tax=Vibrio sp. AND4 TaxID=314289 RepID=UPI00015F0EA3|nr:type III secretion system needle length determinant [Vibrio sp. AND4]EDP58956.1 leucine-responsive transcriptional regulator [Vibrio sp. AND4]